MTWAAATIACIQTTQRSAEHKPNHQARASKSNLGSNCRTPSSCSNLPTAEASSSYSASIHGFPNLPPYQALLQQSEHQVGCLQQEYLQRYSRALTSRTPSNCISHYEPLPSDHRFQSSRYRAKFVCRPTSRSLLKDPHTLNSLSRWQNCESGRTAEEKKQKILPQNFDVVQRCRFQSSAELRSSSNNFHLDPQTHFSFHLTTWNLSARRNGMS